MAHGTLAGLITVLTQLRQYEHSSHVRDMKMTNRHTKQSKLFIFPVPPQGFVKLFSHWFDFLSSQNPCFPSKKINKG